MKNLILIVSCFLFLSLGSGCGRSFSINEQKSSKEEALYKSGTLENFGENIMYLSVVSVTENSFLHPPIPVSPKVRESSEISLIEKEFTHIIVNKDKNGKLWLVFLKDTRPPEIVFKKELN